MVFQGALSPIVPATGPQKGISDFVRRKRREEKRREEKRRE
jgi:hypothetical protein